jgi:hypothetical protein
MACAAGEQVRERAVGCQRCARAGGAEGQGGSRGAGAAARPPAQGRSQAGWLRARARAHLDQQLAVRQGGHQQAAAGPQVLAGSVQQPRALRDSLAVEHGLQRRDARRSALAGVRVAPQQRALQPLAPGAPARRGGGGGGGQQACRAGTSLARRAHGGLLPSCRHPACSLAQPARRCMASTSACGCPARPPALLEGQLPGSCEHEGGAQLGPARHHLLAILGVSQHLQRPGGAGRGRRAAERRGRAGAQLSGRAGAQLSCCDTAAAAAPAPARRHACGALQQRTCAGGLLAQRGPSRASAASSCTYSA